MRQISYFHKGINTDLDYSKLDNSGFLLPTANIQIVNKEGQGLIVTPVKGNKSIGRLTREYQVIGACEYNGIAYIISFNPQNGRGEIGSFPSPNDQGTGFEEVYRPFKNFGTENMSLRSVEFDFSLDSPIGDEARALLDYDGSVNVVFTDFRNELRIVNSGFDQDGKNNGRFYQLQNLAEQIKLIKALPENQKIEFVLESDGGQLEFGTYFFFYRYVTASNDRTEFVAESLPYVTTRNITENESLRMSGIDGLSGKKILIKISNLDTSFSYVEFAYMRFSADQVNNVIPETRLVDNFFRITSEEITLEITGFETVIPIDIGEILRPVNNETICKSIASQNRRLWGGYWKSKEINHDALAEYALNIRLTADDSDVIQPWQLRNYYGRPQNYFKAGYFRGETYITGVSFELNNGYETERFPVKGIDAYNIHMPYILLAYDGANTLTNNNGIIRMPANWRSPYIRKRDDGIEGRILSLVFNMEKANTWLQSNSEEALWIKENVRSIKFLRAERVPNLLYQGVSVSVAGREVRSAPSGPLPDGTAQLTNSVSVPRFSLYFPATVIYSNGGRRFHFAQANSITSEEENIRAIFSPDFIFKKDIEISETQEYHGQVVFPIDYSYELNDNVIPPFIFKSVEKPNPQLSGPVFKFSQIQILKDPNNWITPSNTSGLRLINKADEVIDGQTNNSLFWNSGFTIKNRNMTFAPYIGVKIPDNTIPQALDTAQSKKHLINIYRQNPKILQITDLYLNESNLRYKKITGDIIKPLDFIQNVKCFQGDSFVQLTTIKVISWHPSVEKGHHRDEADNRLEVGASISANGFGVADSANRIKYSHGLLQDFITENSINNALRIRTVTETDFYPALENNIDIGEDFTIQRRRWAVWPYSTEVSWTNSLNRLKILGTGIESYLVNQSNSVTLSNKPYLAFNPNIPKGRDIFPNRIRYTGQQEPNFPPLAYRIWNYNFKEDFDASNGDIIKLLIVFGRLVSVQESSILLHFINREEVIATSTGEMVIGVRSILSKEPVTLSRFGSQHRFGAINVKSGAYGWDWMNNKMWRIVMNDEGIIIARSIDKEYMIENYLKERKLVSFEGNINKRLPDLIFRKDNNQSGVIMSYNPEMSEILFTSVIKGNVETMRFSEDLNTFIGTYSYPAKMHFNINESTLSISAITPNDDTEEIFLHNIGNPANFYRVNYNPTISFIVNGFTGDQSSAVNIDKLFKAMEIESPRTPMPIEKIDFITSYQKAQNNPFDTEDMWLEPEYLQSKYAFPINVAYEGQEQFEEESNLTGKWMKVTVTLNKAVDTFIKNIITIFITSKS